MKPDDLEGELAQALRQSETNVVGSTEAIVRIREQALEAGNERLATACLKALGVVVPAAQWVDLYANALVREEPTAASHAARASALAKVDRRADAMRDYLVALELEGPDGDREVLEICLLGLAQICRIERPARPSDSSNVTTPGSS
jgi:hypothetical protein